MISGSWVVHRGAIALLPGDPVSRITLAGVSTPRFVVDSAAGRYLLIAFVRAERAAVAEASLKARPTSFDDVQASAFIVVVGEDPAREQRRDTIPGLRFLFDVDGAAAALYDADEEERWLLVDPALQLMAIGREDRAERIADLVVGLAPPSLHGGFEGQARERKRAGFLSWPIARSRYLRPGPEGHFCRLPRGRAA